MNKKQIWVTKEFDINLKKLFPSKKSQFERTKEFDKIFEKIFLKKKGSVDDIYYIIAGIFMVVIVLVFTLKLINSSNSEIQNIAVIPQEAKDTSSTMSTAIPHVFDLGIVILFVGLMIVTLILSSLVPIHPVFLVFAFILMVIGIIFGGYVANAYDMLMTNASLATEASQLFWTSILFRYLPYIIAIFSILLMIIMYKVWGGNENQQNY